MYGKGILRTYSSSVLHAIIICNQQPFFKIFLNFVHFCPNFKIFCPFSTFLCPFLEKSHPCPYFVEYVLMLAWNSSKSTHFRGILPEQEKGSLQVLWKMAITLLIGILFVLLIFTFVLKQRLLGTFKANVIIILLAYLYMYMRNHENSCPPGYHHNGFVGTHAQVHELSQSHCGDNQEGTSFSWLHIYYTHLASVRFEHSVCRGSLMTTIYMFTHFF